MAIQTNAMKEALAAAYAAQALYVSLHTADPGTTGINEATGGSPAYARQPISWTAGASDGITVSSTAVIDVPAGTYTHVGVWSALTGGVFYDSATVSATFAGQGQYRVTLTFTQS